MPTLKVGSWNVEHKRPGETDGHFRQRLRNVVELLAAENLDLFALYEIRGKDIWEPTFELLPGFAFFISEGLEQEHVLVGVKRSHLAFVTQRDDFESGITHQRPGVLVTLKVGDQHVAFLFLHAKAGSDPRAFGLRDDMLRRALELKKSLDAATPDGDVASYVLVGDLHTAGQYWKYRSSVDVPLLEGQPSAAERAAARKIWGKVDSEEEIERLAQIATRSAFGMRMLAKTAPHTWWNGSHGSHGPANFDHVLASQHLQFAAFAAGAEVRAMGWPEKPTVQEHDDWIRDFSDHALLRFDLELP